MLYMAFIMVVLQFPTLWKKKTGKLPKDENYIVKKLGLTISNGGQSLYLAGI